MTKNIVFLNLAVMPYHVAVFKALIAKGYNCRVYWYGRAPKTAYRAPAIKGMYLYNRFDFTNTKALVEHSSQFNPILIVCAGWADRDYNKASGLYRRERIPTVAMSDTQWRGGLQWINRFLSPLRHKRWFDYIWGAGILQFDYARKLGFKADRILLNCFSGDIETFTKVSINAKKKHYPKNFLFVGRFVHVKAIDVLLKAWSQITDKNGWTLTLIGDGPLKEQFKSTYPDVIIKDFMPQSELAKEAQNAGCFVIPSRFEPWALVIQEFAVAGLPIIATRQCGASRHFVLNGYNGYTIDADDIDSMVIAMKRIMKASIDTLFRYSNHSRELGMQCTPEFVADTLLSILK